MSEYAQQWQLFARKVLDDDYAAEPSQDLIGGGTAVINGRTWTIGNEANASTFDIAAAGLRPWPNTTASAWGRPTTATAPFVKLPAIQALLARARVYGILMRLHLDTSSADASNEFAGACLIDTNSATFGMSAGVGHNGVTTLMRGYRDTTVGTSLSVTAAQAGADAVIGYEYSFAALNLLAGDAVGGLPSFADMVAGKLRMSGNANPAAGQLGVETDLYLYAEPNNVAGNFQPVIKRLEVWFVEARLP